MSSLRSRPLSADGPEESDDGDAHGQLRNSAQPLSPNALIHAFYNNNKRATAYTTILREFRSFGTTVDVALSERRDPRVFAPPRLRFAERNVYSFSRPCGRVRSMAGPNGTIPVGLISRWVM